MRAYILLVAILLVAATPGTTSVCIPAPLVSASTASN